MGKVKELFREQQEVDMFNSLECREAYLRGYEKGYDDGWYAQKFVASLKYPTCWTCKYRQFGGYCSLLDMQPSHNQICDNWEFGAFVKLIYGKSQVKYLSMIKAGIIKESK